MDENKLKSIIDAEISNSLGYLETETTEQRREALQSYLRQPYSEFLDCERIFNYDTNICTGCFNTHRLDAGDWEWCPEHKNTDRMFECTKTITSFKVIGAIDKLLNIYNKN